MSDRCASRAGDLAGQRVTVMGLGLFGGGAGAARWAMEQGARVTITDQKDRTALANVVEGLESVDAPHAPRFTLGGHEPADFEDADVLIVNPAVPPSSPWIERARRHGARVTSDIALLLERNPARVVAVTGTHGKSSTASFIKGLVERALEPEARCLLGGNIGVSLLQHLGALSPRDVLVLELSSYQLEHLSNDAQPSVEVAAITNIGVDHLERHGSVESYRDAKLRIVDLVHPGGCAILPAGEVAELVEGRTTAQVFTHGADADFSLTGSDLLDRRGAEAVPVADATSLQVPGDFQRQNLLVALAAGLSLGFDAASLRPAIPHLEGLSHRMESLGQFTAGPAAFELIDNGISTTPESTLAAVESVRSPGPSLLIAGGQAKRGVDLGALTNALARSGGWVLVPFGAAAEALSRAARDAGAAVDDEVRCESAEQAAARAVSLAKRDGATTVLFSPACASFDRYPNFKVRAMAFRRTLRELTEVPAGARR